MPAQKRPFEGTTPPASPPPPEEPKTDDSPQGSENHSQEQAGKESGSDESSYSSGGEKDEYIVMKLAEVRKEVQCPICLGIIRKTRTVMECLHRFCRECIDKSMRLGNNECPACRTHCASRRSLRDDPNYDGLIAALYPDIDKYEEEELAFNEEEKARNKHIQDLIAQTFRRQAEELGKKKTSSRNTYSRRHSTYRNLRGRKSQRVIEQGSDEEEEANEHDVSKDSSSADERSTENKSKRHKRWSGIRTSQGSNADNDNGVEANRDFLGASAAFVGGTEILAWGRGGLRSNTRHGGNHGANGKLSRNNRISRLMDRLRCSNENDTVMNISLTLVTLNYESMPSLKRPYLSCSHTSPIKNLCQYVAMQTSVEASEIEMLMMKNFNPFRTSLNINQDFGPLNPCQCELQVLNEHQTLGEIQANLTQQNLVLAYRKKTRAQAN